MSGKNVNTNQISAALEFRKKLVLQEGLSSIGKEVKTGPLDEVGGARFVVCIQAINVGHDLLRANRGTQTPASHRERLGVGMEDDGALEHARKRDDRLGLNLCENVALRA